MRLPLLTCTFFLCLIARGQLAESFADSNFTADPAWSGTPGAFIVNAQRQLQSAHGQANSSFHLSTPVSVSGDREWSLWLRLAFSTSSANYADVWLISRSADPDSPGNTGYFVRIGGTQDDVCLYRKDAAGTVRIIDGADGSCGGSDNRMQVRVVRRGAMFYLFHQLEGSSTESDGVTTDAIYGSGSYFALQVRQSTSSFFGKHYFDDIRVEPHVPDTAAPSMEWIGALSDSTVEIRFDEPVQAASLQASFFSIQGMGFARQLRSGADAATIVLQFGAPLPIDTPLLLTARHVRDLWGNELLQDTDRFFYHPPQRHDVLITELLADPEPRRALPGAEFIELRNVCRYAVALQGWRIATTSTLSAPLPALWLPPDSALIICSTSDAPQFMGFGRTMGVASFPALDNDGALLRLETASGKTIHAVAYERSWYGDAVKEDGGWSLELVDAANPCAGASNWKASMHADGGTPGRTNSVAGINTDATPPRLVRTYAGDSVTLVAQFSEPLDSLAAAQAHYQLTDGPAITAVLPVAPLFTSVELRAASPLAQGRVYTLVADAVRDCSGIVIGMHNSAPAGLPTAAANGDIVINEILYQPKTGGAEYVEFFIPNGILDLSKMLVATRNSSGALNAPRRLSTMPLQAYPNEYPLITANPDDVASRYFVAHPDWALRLTGMPALSDEGASLVLLNDAGDVLDEVRYDPHWQFALIDDTHGVALERLDAAGPSGSPSNWHSASSSAGYGTPTARNSQYRGGGASDDELTVVPAVFSPDNDGFEDFTTIRYQLAEPGYVASISIFDALGRRVRNLVHGDLLGRFGQWTWDGLDEQHRPLGSGTYVLLIEILNLQGKRANYKRAVAIARPVH